MVAGPLRLLTPSEPVPRRRATDLPGLDDRQRDALGTVHDILQQLNVTVVGVGGTGSPVAEQLVRMGTGSVALVDGDLLDTPSNVRRVVGSTPNDLRATRAPAKVDVVGRHVDQLGLGTPVLRVFGDVRHEHVFRELLDADVVICCTDTHGSRATLNDLASTYLLPVIDVGVQAGAKKNADLAALVAEISVLTPATPCLWCRGASPPTSSGPRIFHPISARVWSARVTSSGASEPRRRALWRSRRSGPASPLALSSRFCPARAPSVRPDTGSTVSWATAVRRSPPNRWQLAAAGAVLALAMRRRRHSFRRPE